MISKNIHFQKLQFFKWLVSKDLFKSHNFFKWLVLNKLPRVTSFDLSHQEIINMWPWHEFQELSRIINDLSSIFQYLLSSLSTDLFDFISLHLSKSFLSTLSLSRKVLCSKTCVIHLFHSLLPLEKERRTNRLNSFVSLFSLTKDSKH